MRTKPARIFLRKIRLTRMAPDIHFAISREIQEPYRTARCVILHLEPFRTGIIIGWYTRPSVDPLDDNAVTAHLRRALTLRQPTQSELDDFNDERKLHGPGKPGGLRFGTAGSSTVRGRSQPGMAAADDPGTGR